jgi:GT2 family glycosyltransferase
LPEKYEIDVFLVDDGSTDNTTDSVKINFPSVNIIKGNGTLFWNRGMHLAWKTASDKREYDYYLWLNDDTYLFENSLDVILTSSNLQQGTAIIVGATCSSKTGEYTYGGYKRSGENVIPSNVLQEIDTFNGNCVLIPKFVFTKVGNLDPLFHHCIGDLDYGYRSQSLGIKSLIAPGYLGDCEEHNTLVDWCQIEVPFFKRLLLLYSPLANSHPYHFFRYELRHYGIFIALKHLLSIHLRVIFPQLWIQKGVIRSK